VAAGGWLAIENIPGLKGQTMALISPRIKEAKMLTTLGQHLDTIQANAQTLTSTASGVTRTQLLEKNKKLIQESKTLLESISDLNSQDSGIVKTGVSTLVNMVLGSSPTPSPASGATPVPAVACPTP